MANILEDVQNYVVGKLSGDYILSACPFLAENRKDIDYEIKNRLGKQGIVGLVMTPKATYAGKFEDLFLSWTLEELEICIVENVTVNRGKRNGYVTGQDAAMRLFDVLCPLSGDFEGLFNPVSYEEGEDGNLIVNKCVLKALIYGEHGDVPLPEKPITYQFVKLLDLPPPLSVLPHDGWMWQDADGLYFYVDHVAHKLGDVSSEQLSAYVESQVSSKVEVSAFNELQNSLSDYYTKNETSSASEISIALDGKQPTGDYALTSQLPTKISELSNDSGYITSAQVIPSQINVGNASTSDKSLVSLALANDVTNEHSTRVVVDEYDNVILLKYTTGWYVSKIYEGTGSPIVYTETDAYYAIVSDVRIEPSEGKLYYTVDCQDKQRNLISKYRESFTTRYSADEFTVDILRLDANEAGHSINIRLTITNAQTPVWVDAARLVPDSSKYSGLLDTQITPNGQFVTPAQVKPFTAIRGYASRALGSLFMFGRSDILTPDENHYITIDYNVGKLCYVGLSYYPWHLSMYNGTTFDPTLEMVYGYRSTIMYKLNNRIRSLYVNSNCWVAIQTVDARNTRPYYILAVENENGLIIPDTNLYITGVAHPITFSTNNLSIETIDGVAGNITCTRQSAGTYTTEFKYFPFENELSVKADLSALNAVENSLSNYALTSQIPLSVSQLENDSGYLTEHQSLSDYYTKNETSSNAEISTALDLKQDTLTSEQLSNIARVPYIDPANTIVTFDDDSVGVYNVVGELTQNIKQEWERLAGAYVKDIKIGTNVNALGNSLFYRAYNNILTKVTIPDSVTSIGAGAFSGCTSLTKVTIPNSVTNIANSAFIGCSNLTSVTIPNGVTSIEGFAFRSCTSLSSVTIPESTTNIGENAFRQSGITNITIPNNISSIGTDAFNSCTNLTSLTFKGKTLAEVQAMSNYPWGISDTSIIKTWNDATQEWVLQQLSALSTMLLNQ